MSESQIYDFLHYAYLPSPGDNDGTVLSSLRRIAQDFPLRGRTASADLLKEGAGAWSRAIEGCLEATRPNCRQVVPLSGGLDSRAILAELLVRVGSKEVVAVTYGTPGTWDYDIAKSVAKASGVEWRGIDLTSSDWSWDQAKLLEAAVNTKRANWVFDACVNRQIRGLFPADAPYWSGFMGDPSAGSHLPHDPSDNWAQAQVRFAELNQFAESLGAQSSGWNPIDCLPPRPILEPEVLCFDEQLDFCVRQECLVKDTVLPGGYNCLTPFLHPSWLSFSLSLPRSLRLNQLLYKAIMSQSYPLLFSLPTKTCFGLPLSTPAWRTALRGVRIKVARRAGTRVRGLRPIGDRAINYVDFDLALRKRRDLREVVCDCLSSLEGNGLVGGLDVQKLWRDHQGEVRNNGYALLLLAALEINLKAGHFARA